LQDVSEIHFGGSTKSNLPLSIAHQFASFPARDDFFRNAV
jgi:hypothetical protein